jgi:fibro-slime domain-containing protein
MKTFKTIIATIVALGISFAWAETVHEFYIFLPNNTTWKSSTPMINEDGKSRKLEIDTVNCGWYYRRYVDEPLPSSVVIHRDDDPTLEDAIGFNGVWEEGAAEPIILDAMFELYSTEPGYNKALYFVADAEESQKLPSSNQGWFVKRPDVRGYCAYSIQSIVYSTKEMPCTNITAGMVESTLDSTTKKMKLTDKGRACFGDKADETFAKMFTATPDSNKSSCFDINMERNKFGKYSTDSISKYIPKDKINDFYCTESHKYFQYKKGLTFSIGGSDYTWVFINNKLAIDFDGSEPRNVDLDKFLQNAEIGKDYIIDIYTCNKHPGSSDLSIATNIFFSLEISGSIWFPNQTCTAFEKFTPDTNYRNTYYCINCPIIKEPPIEYFFSTDKTGQDPTKTIVSIEDFEANPIQFNGGINVEMPAAPVINENLLKTQLPNGKYYLIVKMGTDQKAIEITLKDSEGIANRRTIPADASFNIIKTGSLEFTILTNSPSTAKRYAVMDMMGQVISVGPLNEAATRIKVPTAGSYIIKVGRNYKRVNMK